MPLSELLQPQNILIPRIVKTVNHEGHEEHEDEFDELLKDDLQRFVL